MTSNLVHSGQIENLAELHVLGIRMIAALRAAARIWPGELRISDVKKYDEARTQLTLTFVLKGVEWQKTHLDCCPEAHVEEALRDAITFFAGRPA